MTIWACVIILLLCIRENLLMMLTRCGIGQMKIRNGMSWKKWLKQRIKSTISGKYQKMSKKDKININKKRFPIGAFVPFFELFPEEARTENKKNYVVGKHVWIAQRHLFFGRKLLHGQKMRLPEGYDKCR